MASAGTVTVDFAAETARFTAELKKVQFIDDLITDIRDAVEDRDVINTDPADES